MKAARRGQGVGQLNVHDAGRLLREWLQAAAAWLESYEWHVWAGLFIFGTAAAAFGSRQNKRRRAAERRMAAVRETLGSIHPGNSVEHNLNALLTVVGGMVEAANYAFYTYDDRNQVYVLKAVRRQADDYGKIRPSYSGLKPFVKESYAPPLSVKAAGVAANSAIVTDGEVPLMQIPVGSKLGLIRIGPMGGRLKKSLQRMLDELAYLMEHGLHFMLDKEKATMQADVVISSGRALQQISQIALDSNVTVGLMLDLSMRTIGAASGCFIRKSGEKFAILASKSIDKEIEDQLEGDTDVLLMLHQWIERSPHMVLRRGDEAFYRLPPYLAATGIDKLAIAQADGPNQFIVYGFEPGIKRDNESDGASLLHIIMKDMRELVGYQSSLRQLSATYTNILKKLSQLLDHLSPYTVGYSEQMSRYCIITAQSMGLPEDVVRDIALAAYLSNIGVLGISTELYQKEGKYTDKEFELMKLHAEVGASIVKSTTGNERAASYIMHHHERMDGNGYPSALKDADIPIGAKIIAVVQTFLAKINGRPYRDPLPFSQALKTLKSASGAQLDSEVVRVFIDWYKEKQQDPKFNGRSLGNCWEMNCSPSSVCEHCPAFRRTDVNCWDVQGNNCRAHGKQCETCFVRTELVTRKEVSSL